MTLVCDSLTTALTNHQQAISRKRLPPRISLSAMPTVTTDTFLPFLVVLEQLKPSLNQDIHLLS